MRLDCSTALKSKLNRYGVVFEIVIAFTMKYRIEITTKMTIDIIVELDIDETFRSILQFKLITNYKTENVKVIYSSESVGLFSL